MERYNEGGVMKTVIITGSARGLGFEMAKQFKKNDFNVVISDILEDVLKESKLKLEQIDGKGKILSILCDVTKEEDIINLMNESIKEFKNIDIWINNAGINQTNKAIWEVDSKLINKIIDVDLRGTIIGSKVAFNQMKNQGYGSIYNVEGHGSNDNVILGLSIYGTSKRAVTYFTEALAKETEVLNLPILVGKLSPGIMITDFLTNASINEKILLDEKTKKVYNILGDYPDVIAKFLVDKIIANTRNNVKFNWLTNSKAAFRFMTSGFNKRNFFDK